MVGSRLGGRGEVHLISIFHSNKHTFQTGSFHLTTPDFHPHQPFFYAPFINYPSVFSLDLFFSFPSTFPTIFHLPSFLSIFHTSVSFHLPPSPLLQSPSSPPLNLSSIFWGMMEFHSILHHHLSFRHLSFHLPSIVFPPSSPIAFLRYSPRPFSPSFPITLFFS